MLIKIFGIADLIAAIVFFLSSVFSFIPSNIVMILGLYVLIKGALFALSLDFTSFLDVGAGIIILLSLAYSIHMAIVAIVCIYLIQKGIFSLMS